MNKIKYIALILVLMLGLIGGAYAYWQETLTVDGTVNTAEFDVKFQDLGDAVYFFGDEEITDLGGAYADSDIIDDDKTLDFIVNNTWPGLSVRQNFDINNNSSIPVKLEGIRVFADGVLLSQNDTGWFDVDDALTVVVLAPITGTSNFVALGVASDSNPEEYPLGYVIDAKTSIEDALVRVWVDEDGENVTPDETYEFKIEMEWVQWNKP